MAQADILLKALNGFGRTRGYSFGSDVNAPLFTVAYQKMWYSSKIEACLIRHRQEGGMNVNDQHVMKVYTDMKAEFETDPACHGDLIRFTAEFSFCLTKTVVEVEAGSSTVVNVNAAGSSTVVNVNAAASIQQPRVPFVTSQPIARSKETPLLILDLNFEVIY